MKRDASHSNGRPTARRNHLAPPPVSGMPAESEILERAARHIRLRSCGELTAETAAGELADTTDDER